jgi:hypothetical protein
MFNPDDYGIEDLYSNINSTSCSLDAGLIDEATATRDGVEACMSFLKPERVLEAAAEALSVDISTWDEHRKNSALTVLLLHLSLASRP